MNQDEQNLNLLSTFHYILGGLTIAGSFIFLIHIAIGISIATGHFSHNDPPDAFGWLFVILGSVAMLAGWTIGILLLIAGKKLRQRESRIFCIVVAALACLIQPIGVILGVFAIITLTKESVIRLFATSNGAISSENTTGSNPL